MTMTNEEIVRDYRQSKTPSKQIGILAELDQCDRKRIKEILAKAGCELPGNCENKPKTRSKGVVLAAVPAEELTPELPPAPAGSGEYQEAPELVKLPGAKNDDGKLQLSAVLPELIEAVAKVRAYGKAKYAEAEDWTKVDPSSMKRCSGTRSPAGKILTRSTRKAACLACGTWQQTPRSCAR